ncbi:PIN domain-containing protein [Streptomyces sp. NBC_00138]
MIHSARDSAEATRISTWLHAFDYLRGDDDTFTRALEVQRRALNAGFHHSLSLPDLLIAATAELNRLTVLHYDGDFDMIASLTGQPTEWVVPPGTADHRSSCRQSSAVRPDAWMSPRLSPRQGHQSGEDAMMSVPAPRRRHRAPCRRHRRRPELRQASQCIRGLRTDLPW